MQCFVVEGLQASNCLPLSVSPFLAILLLPPLILSSSTPPSPLPLLRPSDTPFLFLLFLLHPSSLSSLYSSSCPLSSHSPFLLLLIPLLSLLFFLLPLSSSYPSSTSSSSPPFFIPLLLLLLSLSSSPPLPPSPPPSKGHSGFRFAAACISHPYLSKPFSPLPYLPTSPYSTRLHVILIPLRGALHCGHVDSSEFRSCTYKDVDDCLVIAMYAYSGTEVHVQREKGQW